MSTHSRDEYNPLVNGLNTDETIEIGYEAGIYIMNFVRNGCCPMLLLIVGAAALNALAEGSPAGLLLIVVIYNGAAFVAFLLLLFYVVFSVQGFFHATLKVVKNGRLTGRVMSSFSM